MDELKTINLKGLFKKITNDNDTVCWLKTLGLLKSEQNCSACDTPMLWCSSVNTCDKYEWRCNQITCRNKCSIRTGSFFANSNLRLMDIIQFIYMWATNVASLNNCMWELSCEPQPIYYWTKMVQNVCFELAVLRNPNVIGGKGQVIRIDRSLFSKKKYKIGMDGLEVWIFGGINIRTDEMFLVPVTNNDAESLLPIVWQHVRPESIIISDLWSENSRLNEFGYVHIPFELDTGTKKTALESLWSKVKWNNTFEFVNTDDLFNTFLIEFFWRQKFGQEPFFNIIDHIRQLYTVSNVELLPAIFLINGNEYLEIHCNGPSFATNEEDYPFVEIQSFSKIEGNCSKNVKNVKTVKNVKNANSQLPRPHPNVDMSSWSKRKRKRYREKKNRKATRCS